MRLLLPLLLMAAAVAAQAPYDGNGIRMLPGISPQQRNRILAIHRREVREAATVWRRIAQIDKRLKQKPNREEAKKLGAERRKLLQAIEQAYRRMETQALDVGLLPEQLERLERMPTGPLAEQRYNHGVVLEAPDLTGAQASLLRHLVASTDAAQQALLVQQQHVVRGIEEIDKVLKRRLVSSFDRQRRDMERRFWRIAYYVLTAEQMRVCRTLLSPRYAYLGDLQREFLALPGITPSQSSRIVARFTEYQSESAADRAEIRRCQVELRNRELSKAKRQATQEQLNLAYRRNGALYKGMHDGLVEILVDAQKVALESLPPQVSVFERRRQPWEITNGMTLRAEQRKSLQALRQQDNRFRGGAYRAFRQEQGKMGSDIGPESPQQMMMQTMNYGFQTRMADHARAMGQRLVLEVLAADQIADWVIGTAPKS